MTRDLAVIRLDRTRVDRRGRQQLYTMGENPLVVSGAQSLAQIVTIGLLSRPGSHILDQSFGVGMRDILLAATSIDAVKADAVVAISRLRDQIIQRQAGETVPDDERLTDLRVASVFQDGETYVIHINIITAAGSSLTINSQDFIS